MEPQFKELVSIIIPTYKNRGNLTRAIDSALDQDYQSIEVIVVDDNDPDSTYRRDTEACMVRYNADNRVIYLKHSENRNGAAARNTGINHSSGSFIAFLDDDDLYLPPKISAQIDYIKQHPEFDAVYCQAIKRGKVIAQNLPEGDLAKRLLLMETHMFTPSLMFRREALKTIGGFDESFRRHQDYELLLKFFRAGFKIGVVQKPLIEIGANLGENVQIGKAFEQTKRHFLDTFNNEIVRINESDRGFKNRVYATHYSGIFLGYIKSGQPLSAVKIFNKFFWKSPAAFLKPIYASILYHLSIKKV